MNFRPFDVIDIPKARYGRGQDGGYVILDSPLGAKHILGYGVDKDLSFENELTEAWGIKAHVFDHTITEAPSTGPSVTYVAEGIGPVDAAPLFSLATHVERYVPQGSDFILKMDVEGSEWDVLRSADLSRVSQLIIELHELQDPHYDVIEKLNKMFYLVHIHGNNCHNQPWVHIDRVHAIPRYLECTYVRKDLVTATPSIQKFPTNLDRKCREDVPELGLNFWEPCERPFSFVVQNGTDTTLLEKLMTREDEIVSKIEDAKWPRTFFLYKGDVFPFEIIMKLRDAPDGDINYVEILNGSLMNYSTRVRFANGASFTCTDKIFVIRDYTY
jgi:hypothetical protein